MQLVLDPIMDITTPEAKVTIIRELREPGAERIWYIADAMRHGMIVERYLSLTNIDRWFLVQIEEFIRRSNKLRRVWLVLNARLYAS